MHKGGTVGTAEEDIHRGMSKAKVSFFEDGKTKEDSFRPSSMVAISNYCLVNSPQYHWFGPPHPELEYNWAIRMVRMVRRTDDSDSYDDEAVTVPTRFSAGNCFSLSCGKGSKIQFECMLLGMRREGLRGGSKKMGKFWTFVFLVDYPSLVGFFDHKDASNRQEMFVRRIFHREMNILFKYVLQVINRNRNIFVFYYMF